MCVRLAASGCSQQPNCSSFGCVVLRMIHTVVHRDRDSREFRPAGKHHPIFTQFSVSTSEICPSATSATDPRKEGSDNLWKDVRLSFDMLGDLSTPLNELPMRSEPKVYLNWSGRIYYLGHCWPTENTI